jgi:hypothetical protein
VASHSIELNNEIQIQMDFHAQSITILNKKLGIWFPRKKASASDNYRTIRLFSNPSSQSDCYSLYLEGDESILITKGNDPFMLKSVAFQISKVLEVKFIDDIFVEEDYDFSFELDNIIPFPTIA